MASTGCTGSSPRRTSTTSASSCIPEALEPVAVLLEPLSIAEKGIRQAFEIQRRVKLWQPRRAAVMGAGSIGLLTTLAMRLRELEVTVYSRREPPYRNSELVEALDARYVWTGAMDLGQLAQRYGPFDLMFDATGSSPLALGAILALAKNGVLVLAGVTSGNGTAELPTDLLNQRIVLGNQVIVGTVNAHRDDFVAGVEVPPPGGGDPPGLAGLAAHHADRRTHGYAEMLDRLEHDHEAIKVYVEIGADEPKADA